MNVFELAAIATTIRFVFWLLEKMIKTITVLARKRRTMQKGESPEPNPDKEARD